tara:strand:- start:2189 stop:2410 length:222 start_codon:yes stop_codon:yes gene_type:complete
MNHELDQEIYLEMKRKENLKRTTRFQKGKKCISVWVPDEDHARYVKKANPTGLATIVKILLEHYAEGKIEIKL